MISIGAKKIEKNFGKIIRDQYYDNTENYFLVLNDYLLRYRVENNTGKWQLKYPSQPIDRSRDIENYFEAENSQDISQLVLDLAKKRAFFQNKMHMSHLETVESLVSALDLECFVKINSKRKSYRFEMMKIDLDETDFGYKLGEIELILDHGASQETKEESFKKISGLTNQLGKYLNFWCGFLNLNLFYGFLWQGITKHDKIPGKISAYLFQFNTKLFELLRANGIIEDTVAQNLKNLIKKF